MKSIRGNEYIQLFERLDESGERLEFYFDHPDVGADESRALNEAIDAINTAKVALIDAVKAAVVAEIEGR